MGLDGTFTLDHSSSEEVWLAPSDPVPSEEALPSCRRSEAGEEPASTASLGMCPERAPVTADKNGAERRRGAVAAGRSTRTERPIVAPGATREPNHVFERIEAQLTTVGAESRMRLHARVRNPP
jgi:hypothetical protein